MSRLPSASPLQEVSGNRQATAVGHRVARVSDQVAEHDHQLVAIAGDGGDVWRAIQFQFNRLRQRIGFERLLNQVTEFDRSERRLWKSGKPRQRRNDVVRKTDLTIDALQMLVRLFRRWTCCVYQVVGLRSNRIQRVSQFVCDSCCELAKCDQSLLPLLAGGELRLIGVLDDREVEIEQPVQRLHRGVSR